MSALTGKILIAAPQNSDREFGRSVVYIVQDADDAGTKIVRALVHGDRSRPKARVTGDLHLVVVTRGVAFESDSACKSIVIGERHRPVGARQVQAAAF